MDNIRKERVCPICGQPLHFVKSEKDEDMNEETFAIFEIWNCLNCNAEWEFDIEKGGWKIRS